MSGNAPGIPNLATAVPAFTQETLAALFGGMPKGMLYGRLDYADGAPVGTTVVYANPHLMQLGPMACEPGQRVPALLCDAADETSTLRALDRVVRLGEPTTLERYQPTQGLWLLIALHSPNPGHFIAMVSDVTHKRSMELELVRAEQRMRAILESSPVPLCLNDSAGNITFLNKAFRQTFGYTAQDIATLEDWWPRAYPDTAYRAQVAQSWLANVAKSQQDGLPFERLQVVVRCKDGTQRTVLADAMPLGEAFGETHVVVLYDITEQTRALQALAQTQRDTESMLNSVGEGLCRVDVNGLVTFINPVGAQLLGYRPDEMVGQHAHRLFHHTRPDGSPYPEAECAGHTAMRLGRAFSVDNEMFWRKDGSGFPVHYTAAPMVLDGVVQGEVLTFRDTTLETRTRHALVEKEVKLRKAQEIAGIGDYTLDLRTGLWESSPTLDTIFGIGPDFARTVDGWNQLIAAEHRPMALDHLHLVLGGYCDFRLDYRIARQSDGAARWVAGNGEIERDAQGQALRLIGTIQDITERKRIESELQQSHDLLQKLSRELPGVLFQFLMHPDGRFTAPFASAGLLDMYGLSPDTVRHDASVVFAAVVPEDRERFVQQVMHNTRTLTNWSDVFQVEVPGKGRCWRQGQARPERLDDGTVVWYGFTSDATERMRSRQELQDLNETLEQRVLERTRELAEALDAAELAKRSRGQFLANMSHEIRTPMNAVMGMVYLALKASPNPDLRQYLEKIQQSSAHLLAIINDILDFSKIDAGKLHIELAPSALQALLQQVLALVEGKARDKGLALRLEMGPGVPPFIHCDALRLGQVLINFLNNACKFTERGEVVLRVSNLHTDAHTPHCQLRMEVQDTGLGLQPDQCERVFRSFEQGDNSTTRKYGGTGLGLAISRQLADLMGGEVGVDSTPGVGSCFWFMGRFEVAQAPVKETVVSSNPKDTLAALRGKRALVVDDNEFNLEVACDLLRDVGMEVAVAANGALAIDAMQSAAFDAVLMDVQMPVMDGHEATRRIRKDPKLAHTVVLAMTANAGPEDQALCLQAGMGEVITKPIDPDLLFAALARWISKPQTAQPALSLVQEAAPSPSATAIAADAPAPVTPAPDAPAPAAPSAADWDQFAAWDATALSRIVGDNPATQQRLLSKYRVTATETVTSIRICAAGADWAEVSELAHKLKSSSRSVGALRLGALCEALERQGRAGSAQQCAQLVPLVLQAFDHVQAVLSAQAPA